MGILIYQAVLGAILGFVFGYSWGGIGVCEILKDGREHNYYLDDLGVY